MKHILITAGIIALAVLCNWAFFHYWKIRHPEGTIWLYLMMR